VLHVASRFASGGRCDDTKETVEPRPVVIHSEQRELASAETVPRRALLVDKEVAIAVDPIGVVRSTSISTSISLNFFCEFVKPLLDFDLPSGYC
jgi:hypothetical protein